MIGATAVFRKQDVPWGIYSIVLVSRLQQLWQDCCLVCIVAAKASMMSLAFPAAELGWKLRYSVGDSTS